MGEVCVVTGGRGFAARHLVLQLLRSDRWQVVRILDLSPAIKLDPLEEDGLLSRSLASGKAQYVCADLRDPSQVLAACKGAAAVFHMAAPDSSINSFSLHYSVSVEGTRNIITACIHNKVQKLIYTSSPSTVFDGIHGIKNGDESLPYPDKHNDIYSETKAQGEALVLSANGKSGLVTCAIRPSSIFGPGDRLLVPSLVSAARSGKMKFILGDGKNMYDFTYVENVAHAHVCAEQALDPAKWNGDDVAAGKAYFITNKEPKRFWDFVSEILEGLGYERPKIHLPVDLLIPLASIVEWVNQRFPASAPSQFTPSRLRLVTSWRTFNCDRATRLLGYSPIVSLEEGMRRTIESYAHLRAEAYVIKSRELGNTSKAHKFLGGGNVADLLLWRNETHTFAVGIGISMMIYFLFIASATVLSAFSKLCMVLVLGAFIQNYLPASLFGKREQLFPPFELSEDAVNMAVQNLASIWNSFWDLIEDAFKNHNIPSAMKVMLVAFAMKILGRYSFPKLLLVGYALSFIVFYIYEKKEAEVDNFFASIKQQTAQYWVSLSPPQEKYHVPTSD